MKQKKASSQKSLIIFICIGLVFFAIGYLLPKNSTSNPISSPTNDIQIENTPEKVIYTSKIDGFSVEVPGGWSIQPYAEHWQSHNLTPFRNYNYPAEDYNSISITTTDRNDNDSFYPELVPYKAGEKVYQTLNRFFDTHESWYTERKFIEVKDVSTNGVDAALISCGRSTPSGGGTVCDNVGNIYYRYLYIRTAKDKYLKLSIGGEVGDSLYKEDLATWIPRIKLL